MMPSPRIVTKVQFGQPQRIAPAAQMARSWSAPPMQNLYSDDSYALFFVNDHWYLFFRCTICCQSTNLAADEAKERKDRKESTAVALRLKPRSEVEVEDYYPVFLDMVKSLLDGNMDGTQYEDTLREMFGIHAYTVFHAGQGGAECGAAAAAHRVRRGMPALHRALCGGAAGWRRRRHMCHRRTPWHLESSYQKKASRPWSTTTASNLCWLVPPMSVDCSA
ncbi:hypothetical protein HPB49_000246 [Dermacentor silvarum]|uniref:Uncharacterized protein n=1 Tax=Dermacentor silvarum TaxID=543639 RepID=A0ACB8CNL1_DERSI|nr:hypothetical protein HPB49_000246 [Dermacentor silvarum]